MICKKHRQAIVTLVERKSKLTLIARVRQITAEVESEAIAQLLKLLYRWVHALTAGNG